LVLAQPNCGNDNVDLGSDLTFCSGSTVNLSANVSGVNNSDISNYTWELNNTPVFFSANSDNYSFTLTNSTQGTYVVTVNFDNNYNCPSITDTIVVTVLQLSPGTISGNLMICDGSNPPAFTSVTPGTTGSNISYQWQSSTDNTNWNDINGETNATYNPGPINSIIYYRRLVIYNGPGNNNCQVASNVVSLQEVSGNINIQGNNSICVNQGSTNPLTTTFSSNPNNLSPTYSWSGPNGFSSTILSPTLSAFNSNQAGTYTVTATIPNVFSSTNNGLCQVTDNVTINLNPLLPTFSIPATGCPGTTVNITGFTPQTGVTYTWHPTNNNGISFTGQNTSTPTINFSSNASGNYSVFVAATSNSNGCPAHTLSQIISTPNFGIDAPFISVNGTYYNSQIIGGVLTYPICSGISTSNILLENASFQNNQNPVGTTYTLTIGNGTPQPLTDSLIQNIIYGNNTYTITATYNGCSKYINFSVYSGSNPYVAIGAQNSIGLCPGNAVNFTVDPIPNSGIQNPP
jgi:hypothetical protein